MLIACGSITSSTSISTSVSLAKCSFPERLSWSPYFVRLATNLPLIWIRTNTECAVRHMGVSHEALVVCGFHSEIVQFIEILLHNTTSTIPPAHRQTHNPAASDILSRSHQTTVGFRSEVYLFLCVPTMWFNQLRLCGLHETSLGRKSECFLKLYIAALLAVSETKQTIYEMFKSHA